MSKAFIIHKSSYSGTRLLCIKERWSITITIGWHGTTFMYQKTFTSNSVQDGSKKITEHINSIMNQLYITVVASMDDTGDLGKAGAISFCSLLPCHCNICKPSPMFQQVQSSILLCRLYQQHPHSCFHLWMQDENLLCVQNGVKMKKRVAQLVHCLLKPYLLTTTTYNTSKCP